jgi:hypothetical protein
MLALGGLDIAAEVNGHAGRIAHGPRIMTGFDGGNITRADLTLLSTVRLDAQPAREAVQKVRRLATLRPDKRLQVLRPPPAGLVRHVQDRVPCDVHHCCLTLTHEGARLVGLADVLDLKTSHGYSSYARVVGIAEPLKPRRPGQRGRVGR